MKEKQIINLQNPALLNESSYIYDDFSKKVREMLLGLIYAGVNVPISVVGSASQVDSFFKALNGEKKYMDSYVNNGLNDQRTLRSKYALNRSVEKFEKETGLKWPFKN